MGGEGFLLHAIKSLKYNRSLRQREQISEQRETVSDEILDKSVDKESIVEGIEIRTERLKSHASHRLKISLLLAVTVTVSIGFSFFLIIASEKETVALSPMDKYFDTRFVQIDETEKLQQDYFKMGPIAAETRYFDGIRHQNSESYYPSGRQFRSALYDCGTLIIDIYFYPNGDTIQNFPEVPMDRPIDISFRVNDSTEFMIKYLDGKLCKPPWYNYSVVQVNDNR